MCVCVCVLGEREERPVFMKGAQLSFAFYSFIYLFGEEPRQKGIELALQRRGEKKVTHNILHVLKVSVVRA